MEPKIIAEIASSHNGDMELAKKMIKAAARAGVDIVKFQSWQSKNVADSDPDKDRYRSLELSDEDHFVLKDECEKNGMEFLTTCYDAERIPFLKQLGLRKIKVSSTDLKHFNFLKKIRGNFEEVIVSAGMSAEEEILKAVEILKSGKFTIMHCVSIYPCPLEKANLRKLLWLKKITPSVGYSDHTQGFAAPVLAMAMGIDYLEKHFTLDRNLQQTSHRVGEGLAPITTHSIADEPDVFKAIIRWRKIYQTALGSSGLEIQPEEQLVREKYTGRLGKNS
ncbi:MAG: hypothetical protein A2927_03200 [Candidatus Komeilibacteria bacterium RIFCSPLOWO2_01_FULL_45_10]|uniref:PseI/NeuA/B-like domain-containing protein n=1 Tax=Candidatus Komeilibacteria bacterium RIFCSPLOWO2_01_FULL_45_10 TaxID=1798550 RepID=A0A1G2BJG8_9BACT|nr:MAG: hypothetical protein A2927_03200 [Candidatus Komeilibacteria bacterium RIFCSPLOWO2_01_FULL_45_10]